MKISRLPYASYRVYAAGLLSVFLLACLTLADVVATEEDERVKSMMDLMKKAKPKDPRIRDPLEVLPDMPEAPDFTLETFDGDSFSLGEHRDKYIFVHFWSVYCPHCTRELSTLDQLFELYRTLKAKGMLEEAEFLAINFGEERDKIVEWAEAHDVSLEPDPEGDMHLLLDADKEVAKDWKLRGLPSTFILNGEGKIVARAIGERDWTTPTILRQLELLPALGQFPK